jgi:hypothetical protein
MLVDFLREKNVFIIMTLEDSGVATMGQKGTAATLLDAGRFSEKKTMFIIYDPRGLWCCHQMPEGRNCHAAGCWQIF